MKVIWEEKDIRPGRRYSKPGIGETWIVGFLADATTECASVSISAQDGMVTGPRTKEQLAQLLTEQGYLPTELLYDA